jgi:hypothetical protein
MIYVKIIMILGPFSGGRSFGISPPASGWNSTRFEWSSTGYTEWSGYEVSMITLPFGNFFIEDKILLTALRCPSLGIILNLLIVEVTYAMSNLPKTIIQIQQPIIDPSLVD